MSKARFMAISVADSGRRTRCRLETAPTREMRASTGPFDVVVEGVTPAGDPTRTAEIRAPYAEAGATWWLETMWACMPSSELSYADALARVRDRISAGPN